MRKSDKNKKVTTGLGKMKAISKLIRAGVVNWRDRKPGERM